MKELENNLYYEEEGDINEDLVIFLHSNLLSSWIWKNQRDSFKDYHCIYLDLPNHGNSYFTSDFSIKNSGELIKDLIEKKSIIGSKSKRVHLVGISVGGQIILYLSAKYPELIDTSIVTGVNLYENHKNESISEIITMFNKLKRDILDKKPNKFLIKALLAEYGLGNEYYDDLKKSTEKIIDNDYAKKNNENNNNNLNNIIKESLKFKIPEIKYSKSDNYNISNYNVIKNNYNTNIDVNIDTNDTNIDTNMDNDSDKDISTNHDFDLLVLYGTKEYPKIRKSADLIKNRFQNAEIFSVYRSIHLWNIIDYGWFNETVKEFITNKSLDLNEKPYLKRINR